MATPKSVRNFHELRHAWCHGRATEIMPKVTLGFGIALGPALAYTAPVHFADAGTMGGPHTTRENEVCCGPQLCRRPVAEQGVVSSEENISTESSPAQAQTWVSRPHGDTRRPRRHQSTPFVGPSQTDAVLARRHQALWALPKSGL
jgi:hypothetical protein